MKSWLVSPRSASFALCFAVFAPAILPAEAQGYGMALAESIKYAAATGSEADTGMFLLDAPPVVKLVPPAVPGKAQTGGKIELKRFKRLHWSPDKNTVTTEGKADIVYTRSADKKVSTLTASDLNYNFETGIVTAAGGIELSRAEGNFKGEATEFDLVNDVGFVTEAQIETPYFRMKGKRIEVLPNQIYLVTNGEFTTCEHTTRPDYHIAARSIKVVANQSVSARHITLYAGPTRLISLPSYKRDLRRTTSVPTPQVSYSKSEGLTGHYASNLISEPRRSLDLDARIGLRYPIIGFLTYRQDLQRIPPGHLPPLNRAADLTDPLRGILEQLSPPTFDEYTEGRFPVELGPRITVFGALQSRQRVVNRRRYDLLLSRFPEAGVNFANLLGHTPNEAQADRAAAALNSDRTRADVVLKRIPNAPFLLDASVAYGNIFESPTRTNTSRFSTRLNIASQPILMGKRLSARFAATNFLNYYGTGTVYNLFAPEADLNYLPTSTSLLGIGYRYSTDSGRTPFAFDHKDVTQQLRLRYQVGGAWAFGVQAGYDLRTFANYETQVALIRNFDCLQIGLSYQFRAQSFNIIFNLLPPTANRERNRREPIPDILPPAAPLAFR